MIAMACCALSLVSIAHAETEYAEVVEGFASAMEDHYVFPDVGARCAALLRDELRSGAYDGLGPEELATRVHEQLREITHDLHFGVRYNPPQQGAAPTPIGEIPEVINHGFRKVELLDGNVGYLDFRFFESSDGMRATVDAAMAFLRDSDALIIDMRRNGGGQPDGVRYVCSYFFGDEPVLLNSIYDRTTNETEEFWTLADLPEKRFASIPMYVLTSANTFSGAEELCYNLQTRGRATIVGEVTGGGAHPVMGIDVGEGFSIGVPFARAINPVTGTNWEGVGIRPDIGCNADTALDVAHMKALETLSASATGGKARRLAWASDFIRSRINPVVVDRATLAEYVGSYGPRQVTFRDGSLWYSRGGGPERRLNAISADTFMVDGVDFFRMTFERDSQGRVARILGSYVQGHSDTSERDG
ncbi:MAG: peptidase S41 [Phycisphaeraceae bacterium]|nr:peptidase S41 [Phycisphaeraceae bacterium]MCB9848361.1 peptidase S41 [Phycisphaeraceae bacterium]